MFGQNASLLTADAIWYVNLAAALLNNDISATSTLFENIPSEVDLEGSHLSSIQDWLNTSNQQSPIACHLEALIKQKITERLSSHLQKEGFSEKLDKTLHALLPFIFTERRLSTSPRKELPPFQNGREMLATSLAPFCWKDAFYAAVKHQKEDLAMKISRRFVGPADLSFLYHPDLEKQAQDSSRKRNPLLQLLLQCKEKSQPAHDYPPLDNLPPIEKVEEFVSKALLSTKAKKTAKDPSPDIDLYDSFLFTQNPSSKLPLRAFMTTHRISFSQVAEKLAGVDMLTCTKRYIDWVHKGKR